MRLRAAAVVALLLATGCTPTIKGQTPNSIVLGDVDEFTEGQAFDIAQRHCQQTGRNARAIPDTLRDGNVTFECID